MCSDGEIKCDRRVLEMVSEFYEKKISAEADVSQVTVKTECTSGGKENETQP